jgi:hypothetical protein
MPLKKSGRYFLLNKCYTSMQHLTVWFFILCPIFDYAILLNKTQSKYFYLLYCTGYNEVFKNTNYYSNL